MEILLLLFILIGPSIPVIIAVSVLYASFEEDGKE